MHQSRNIELASLLAIVVVSLSGTVLAHNKVVVVPLLGDSSESEPLQNVIRVSRENGDFSSISSAIGSIQNASESNRYTVVIGPGNYNIAQSVEIPDYVSVLGSGARSTIIDGAISSNVAARAAMFEMHSSSTLSGLRINNLGGPSALASGINVDGTSVISDVEISVRGSRRVYGIYTRSEGGLNIRPVIEDSSIFVSASTPGSIEGCRGIYNQRSEAIMRGLRIVVRCSNARNSHGIYQQETGGFGRFSEIHNSEVFVSASSENNVGIYNLDSSMLISGSRITGLGVAIGAPANAYGYQNATADSYARIAYSTISGGTRAMRANLGAASSETNVVHSTLNGSVLGDPRCQFNVDRNLQPLDEECR